MRAATGHPRRRLVAYKEGAGVQGHAPERSSQVICRGNLNVAQHRLCDTMSAFMRLQEDARRGARFGEVTAARSRSEAIL